VAALLSASMHNEWVMDPEPRAGRNELASHPLICWQGCPIRIRVEPCVDCHGLADRPKFAAAVQSSLSLRLRLVAACDRLVKIKSYSKSKTPAMVTGSSGMSHTNAVEYRCELRPFSHSRALHYDSLASTTVV
jgi:hypothetical protein